LGMRRPVRGGDASPLLSRGGRGAASPSQRAPRAKSEISCGVAVQALLECGVDPRAGDDLLRRAVPALHAPVPAARPRGPLHRPRAGALEIGHEPGPVARVGGDC